MMNMNEELGDRKALHRLEVIVMRFDCSVQAVALFEGRRSLKFVLLSSDTREMAISL